MARSKADPKWRRFEEAVAQFASAMDPAAVVRHDVRIPDRDTGRPRQRDVWITAKVCNFFPISVLVSCKRYRRKLHQGDVDAFIGEISSSGAHKGVLYSYSGFARSAVEKAKARGICCCLIYVNEPGEIPPALQFDAYCCNSRIALDLERAGPNTEKYSTWNDLFSLALDAPHGRTVLDVIEAAFHQAENEAIMYAGRQRGIPDAFRAEIEVPACAHEVVNRIVARGSWNLYRAGIEAFLLNGSYSLTSGEFKGEVATPSIDRLSSDPGPGWEPVVDRPFELSNTLVTVLFHGDVRAALASSLGPKQLPNGV